MRSGRGDWVAKIGAEGVQGIGVRGAGIGIAVKVADGSKRALRPVVVSVLDQLGLLDERRRSELAQWVAPVIHNHRGLVTGHILSKVVLDKTDGPAVASANPLEPSEIGPNAPTSR